MEQKNSKKFKEIELKIREIIEIFYILIFLVCTHLFGVSTLKLIFLKIIQLNLIKFKFILH